MDCAILRPAYYRRICKEHPDQFARFAVNVWGIPADGKTKTELAREGVEAFADLIQEFGLPQRLQEFGLENTAVIKRIAGECASSAGSYRGLERREIEALLRECC